MADSKRQKIIDRVIDRAKTILIASGYQTDLGKTVEDWRVDWDEEELPALSVCDLIEETAAAGGQPTASLATQTLPVQLRIFSRSSERAANLRKMLADLEKMVGANQRWNDGAINLATQTRKLRSGIVIPEGSFEIAGAALEIEISYLTGNFNPYE